MKLVEKLLHTTFGKYAISILLGLGLASIFRKVCNERNCMIFRPPPLEEISGKIYKYGDNCYKYKEASTKCGTNKTQVSFA